MPLIGSVADDLTGATTTGVLLARSKARTAVFFNVEAAMKAEGVDELDAIIISSNSRPLPANEAYDKVKDATIALKSMGARYFRNVLIPQCEAASVLKLTRCSTSSVRIR